MFDHTANGWHGYEAYTHKSKVKKLRSFMDRGRSGNCRTAK